MGRRTKANRKWTPSEDDIAVMAPEPEVAQAAARIMKSKLGESLVSYAAAVGVRIKAEDLPDGTDGVWHFGSNSIEVGRSLDPARMVGSISHELSHVEQTSFIDRSCLARIRPSAAFPIVCALEADAELKAITVAWDLWELGDKDPLMALGGNVSTGTMMDAIGEAYDANVPHGDAMLTGAIAWTTAQDVGDDPNYYAKEWAEWWDEADIRPFAQEAAGRMPTPEQDVERRDFLLQRICRRMEQAWGMPTGSAGHLAASYSDWSNGNKKWLAKADAAWEAVWVAESRKVPQMGPAASNRTKGRAQDEA